jgi:hypothetical protein
MLIDKGTRLGVDSGARIERLECCVEFNIPNYPVARWMCDGSGKSPTAPKVICTFDHPSPPLLVRKHTRVQHDTQYNTRPPGPHINECNCLRSPIILQDLFTPCHTATEASHKVSPKSPSTPIARSLLARPPRLYSLRITRKTLMCSR